MIDQDAAIITGVSIPRVGKSAADVAREEAVWSTETSRGFRMSIFTTRVITSDSYSERLDRLKF